MNVFQMKGAKKYKQARVYTTSPQGPSGSERIHIEQLRPENGINVVILTPRQAESVYKELARFLGHPWP